jgi:sulfur carrier protein ThiS
MVLWKYVEVKEDKTIGELLDELEFSTVPILLEVNGLAYYPDEIKGKLREGDRVVLIPIIAGGKELYITH